MTRTHCCAAALAAAAWLGISSAARATVFFTDGFDYADGSLVANSNGNWTSHSGAANQMQVAGGTAIVDISASEDVSRSTGAVIPEGGSWYYGARFKVTAPTGTLQASNYFMHFKDEGTFSFRTRLYITPPNVADPAKFSFALSAGSLTAGPLGTGALVPWTAGDFSYDTEVVVVGKYTSADGLPETPDDGFGQLWINPVDPASTSIIDSNPNPNSLTDDSMSRLALRQGGGAGQPKVLIDVVSVGDNFAAVLAALSPATPTNNPDFNNDGDVDGDDLLIWQQGLGQTGLAPGNKSTGDANGDGSVNGLDLQRWKDRYAMSPSAAAAAAAVPEPGAAALVVIAFLGVAVGRSMPERAAVVIELLNASR